MNTLWRRRAIHFGITWVFCLCIALMQYAFKPAHGLWIPMVYSMLIGTVTIFLVELERYFFVSLDNPHRWPRGLKGLLMAVLPVVPGFIIGSMLADQYFGWSSWGDTRILQSSIAVSIFAGGSISYFFHMRSEKEALLAELKATELQAAEAKLKLLEAQLDPHLLFNTLANLRVLIGVDAGQAQKMLDHMIAYLRSTLSGSRSSEHSIEQEFARLRDYLELMHIRMGPRLSFALDLPESMSKLRIPSLLLQPLVENAIKHGLEPKKAGGHIAVRASLLSGRLSINVDDTGKGMSDTSEILDSKGFGLSQVRERLHTVFGPDATIEVQAQPGEGTQVRLSWPQR